MKSQIRYNILANFSGRMYSLFLAVICTPIYIKMLGIESYGLIGFYITINASLGFLETGLSKACNRELSRASKFNDFVSMNLTLKSLEVIYFILSIIIAIILFFSADWIGTSWIKSDDLSSNYLVSIFQIIALVIAIRWPIGLYNGALMGLEKQILLNIVMVVFSTLGWVGSVLAIYFLGNNLVIFFYWQLLIFFLYLLSLRFVCWKYIPYVPRKILFSFSKILELLPFTFAVGGNAIMGTLIRQIDKIILSAILPLKIFAIYSLASVIAQAGNAFAPAVANAIFPRFSKLSIFHNDNKKLIELYHKGCKTVNVFIMPISFLIMFFSYEILVIYTNDISIAESASLVLPILIFGKLLHSNMIIPYSLQLSFGWVKLSILVNLFSILIIIPLILILGTYYEMIGAAFGILIIYLGYVFISLPIMHKRILKGEWFNWLLKDFLCPMLLVLVSIILCKALSFYFWPTHVLLQVLVLAIFLIFSILFTIFFTKDIWLIFKRGQLLRK